jgi:hypothetical protein
MAARLNAAWTAVRARLIDDASNWWRYWSVRLAAIGSVAVSAIIAYPDILIRTLNELPPEIRAAFPPAAGIVLFALVTLARLYKQQGKGNGG